MWGFVLKKTPKAHILMADVPQIITYTNLRLEFTGEQVVEAQHSCYDALYHRYRTSYEISSIYPQRFLQLVRH